MSLEDQFGRNLCRKSEAAMQNPQTGDYWNEMFCPVCVVVDVRQDSLVICRKTKWFPNDKWSWDLSELTWMPRAEFRSWLSYDSIPGYWASVFPRSHLWVVEALGA